MTFDYKEHPSYGQLVLSRTTCSHPKLLHGSSVANNTIINLELYEGKVARELSGWWYSRGKLIASVEMTPAQWAELISSFNMGSGVPCTIRFNNGEVEPYVEPFPDKTTEKIVEGEYEECITEVIEKIREIEKELEQVPKKSLRQSLQEKLANLNMALSHNIPFMKKRFKEDLEKSVYANQMDFDAWYTHNLQILGMQTLNEHMKTISLPDKAED